MAQALCGKPESWAEGMVAVQDGHYAAPVQCNVHKELLIETDQRIRIAKFPWPNLRRLRLSTLIGCKLVRNTLCKFGIRKQ